MKTWRKTALASVAGVLLLTGATISGAQVVLSADPLPVPTAADRAFLKGAIDIHAHLDPDSFGPHSGQAARSLDVIDLAKRAKAEGMRGFNIKQHYDQTAQLAYLVRKEVPGIETFGQLCLNLTVGGLNSAAVDHFAEVKGGYARIVSMPTWDSENNVHHSKVDREFVAVSKNGELLPEARKVIATIAAAKVRDTGAKLTLATGHISAEEGLMVIREAKKQGVERIIVTHAMGGPVYMTLAQMKEAVSLGAYIEFVGGYVIGKRAEITVQQYLDTMRAIGTAHVILSSDGGQMNRPAPDDMMAVVAGQLKAKGMTNAELRQIMVENPAKALGIAPAG